MPPAVGLRFGLAAPQQPIRFHGAFALHLHRAALLGEEVAVQHGGGFLGELDAPREAARFHTAGDVDGVAPDVVDKFLDADDAGHGGAGVDADADADGLIHFAVAL